MRALLLLVVSTVALCACPGPPPPPPIPDPPLTDGGTPKWAQGTFELGAPSDEVNPLFVTMPATLELHPGAQGGFHVPVMYRVNGKTEPGAVFEHRVTRSRDGVLVSRGSRGFDVTPNVLDAGTAWVSDGPVVIFMCPTPVGVSIIGEEVTFEVAVSSTQGMLLGTVTAKATLQCPASNQFCQSICKG